MLSTLGKKFIVSLLVEFEFEFYGQVKTVQVKLLVSQPPHTFPTHA